MGGVTARTGLGGRRCDRWLWSTVALTIVASVLVQGVLSRPVMRAVEADNAGAS
jgi:hypothetical protein